MASGDSTSTPLNSTRSRPEPPAKRTTWDFDSSPEDSSALFALPQMKAINMEEILIGIDEKLKKLDKLDIMANDIKDLKVTVQTTVDLLQQTRDDMEVMRVKVKKLETSVNHISRENTKMKEKMLEMTTRSMRDNLIFTGIPEKKDETAEEALRNFFTDKLGMSREAAREITFHRAHRLGARRSPASPGNPLFTEVVMQAKPRAVIACFEHYRQRDMVFSLGPTLRGKPFGISQQFPTEIVDRRRALLPIFREEKVKKKGKGRVRLVADKLYIDGELYKDKTVTPWLFLPVDDADSGH